MSHESQTRPTNVSAIDAIAVYYHGYGDKRLVGHISMQGRRPVFGYDTAWLADGLPLSPIEMPLQQGNQLYYGEHASAHYLCGLLADSLPDGWGMLLMDRFFRKQGISASILDRFAYIGDTAMGALVFEPEHHIEATNSPLDLASLAKANEQVLAGEDVAILNQLLLVGGSPQGARPKAMVYFDEKNQSISTQPNILSADNNNRNNKDNVEPWLIKFPAHHEHKDVCKIEAIYADFAKQAGIIMPEHHYFDISSQHSAFGVKRFDRERIDNTLIRKHMHTVAGLLNTDFRLPTLDYTQLLRCTRVMTRSQKQVERAYLQAVFNAVFNNKDDHSKNFSFIMGEEGQWTLSPAYDITYNTGTNGYHQMDMCGEAKHPAREDLLRLAKMGDIKPKKASVMMDDVVSLAQSLPNALTDIYEPLAKQMMQDVQGNIERIGVGVGVGVGKE